MLSKDPATLTDGESKLLLWWYDVVIGAICKDTWHDDSKFFFLFTEKAAVHKLDKGGSDNKYVLIPVSCEGFGLWIVANNYEKWTETFKWMDKNPGLQVPKKQSELRKLGIPEANYTTNSKGRKDHGGITPAGFQMYETLKSRVAELRQGEHYESGAFQEKVKELLRTKYGVTANSPEEVGNNNKRKPDAAPTAPPAKKVLTFLDE